MPYRHDGSGMGGGPLDPKVIGWLWGFCIGAVTAGLALAALYFKYGSP